MYSSSSLSPPSLSLSEVLVLDSSPSGPAKQSSSNSIPSCNVYFTTSAENRCRHHTCGGGDGGGGSGGGVWWLCSRGREMPQGDNYKDFLKNKLNKADVIRRLNEFLKREVPRLHLDYSLVITLKKEAWEILLTGV